MIWWCSVKYEVKNAIFLVCRKWDKYTCRVLFQWFLSNYSYSTEFIHLHVLLVQICCNSWGKNMLWLFGTVKKKYPEKNRNTNVIHFVSCRLSLTTACKHEQSSRQNWIIQRSLVLRLPLTEKKAALQYDGKKSHFHLLCPNLETLCPFVTFVLLPII